MKLDILKHLHLNHCLFKARLGLISSMSLNNRKDIQSVDQPGQFCIQIIKIHTHNHTHQHTLIYIDTVSFMFNALLNFFQKKKGNKDMEGWNIFFPCLIFILLINAFLNSQSRNKYVKDSKAIIDIFIYLF